MITLDEIIEAIYEGKRSGKLCSLCREEKKGFHIHAAEIGQCVRKTQYKRYGLPENEVSEIVQFFLDDGFLHEDSIVERLRKSGIDITDCNTEFNFTYGDQSFPVLLHPDGIINKEIILECKAVKEYAFKKYRDSGELPHWYIAQVMTYMHFLKIHIAYVIVKNRQTSEIMGFQVNYDPTLFAKLMDRILRLKTALETNNLVDRDYSVPSKLECNWCSYFKECWKNTKYEHTQRRY